MKKSKRCFNKCSKGAFEHLNTFARCSTLSWTSCVHFRQVWFCWKLFLLDTAFFCLLDIAEILGSFDFVETFFVALSWTKVLLTNFKDSSFVIIKVKKKTAIWMIKVKVFWPAFKFFNCCSNLLQTYIWAETVLVESLQLTLSNVRSNIVATPLQYQRDVSV